jgi:hypothetical protein
MSELDEEEEEEDMSEEEDSSYLGVGDEEVHEEEEEEEVAGEEAPSTALSLRAQHPEGVKVKAIRMTQSSFTSVVSASTDEDKGQGDLGIGRFNTYTCYSAGCNMS